MYSSNSFAQVSKPGDLGFKALSAALCEAREVPPTPFSASTAVTLGGPRTSHLALPLGARLRCKDRARTAVTPSPGRNGSAKRSDPTGEGPAATRD
ncbi:hypothetical protein STEG23_013295 [Scotinomys teguina]